MRNKPKSLESDFIDKLLKCLEQLQVMNPKLIVSTIDISLILHNNNTKLEVKGLFLIATTGF
ncbi:MAG: hypothetical protein ACJARX_002006 [Psychroserpens sp.]|jgi:hypothetical protein